VSEHDFEPIRGLPGALPPGEIILWQGAPSWWLLAGQAFHIRAVATYFAAMFAWRVSGALMAGKAPLPVLQSAAAVMPIALAALFILAFMAWLNSRTTVYTITNRRLVLRFGAAVPKAINIPFVIVDSAAVKTLANGAGDLALTLKAPNKIAFLQLWPHARPWRMAAPQPTLRAIADVQAVATILTSAIQRVAQVDLPRAEATLQSAKVPTGRPRPEPLPA
jgi:hypothetical protein